MILNTERFQQANAAFDALNAQDPSHEVFDGQARPKELLYAERMSAMLKRYAPDASEALQLAARCQHIQPALENSAQQLSYDESRLPPMAECT